MFSVLTLIRLYFSQINRNKKIQAKIYISKKVFKTKIFIFQKWFTFTLTPFNRHLYKNRETEVDHRRYVSTIFLICSLYSSLIKNCPEKHRT